MSDTKKPTTLRGGNSAFPVWDRVDDEEKEKDELEDCEACDGFGDVWVGDGMDSCRECRGAGVLRLT